MDPVALLSPDEKWARCFCSIPYAIVMGGLLFVLPIFKINVKSAGGGINEKELFAS